MSSFFVISQIDYRNDEALKIEFASVKCHGSVPKLSYSPDPLLFRNMDSDILCILLLVSMYVHVYVC